MAIEFKNTLNVTENTKFHGYNLLGVDGIPKDPGNAPVSEIISLTKTNLTNNMSIVRDEEDSLTYHLKIGGNIAASFTIQSDRFLKTVSFDPGTNILTFVFVTATGETTVPIDLASLIDTYTAGNGLTLSAGKFSVKLSAGESRLIVDENGLHLDITDISNALNALSEGISKEAELRGTADNSLNDRLTVIESCHLKMVDNNLILHIEEEA